MKKKKKGTQAGPLEVLRATFQRFQEALPEAGL